MAKATKTDVAPVPETDLVKTDTAPVPEADLVKTDAAPVPEANLVKTDAAPVPEANLVKADAVPVPENDVESDDEKTVLYVRTVGVERRFRAGFMFTKEPTKLIEEELTSEQIDALVSDSLLEVEME